MDVALIIIVAVLFGVVAFVSLKGRGARRVAREHERGEARVSAEKGKAQHEESQRRQADVRAAHAERASNVGPDTDD
jgi:hypothetical protein